MLGTWLILTCTQDVPQNESSIQNVPSMSHLRTMQVHCRNICQIQFNCYWQSHCRHMLMLHSNVTEMLLVITLQANVEVTFGM